MDRNKSIHNLRILMLATVLSCLPLQALAAVKADLPPGSLADLKDQTLEYVNIYPNILTNLKTDDRPQFIEIKGLIVALNARDGRLIKDHMPQIRNYLILMLTEKRRGDIYQRGGRRKLQEEALAAIQKILKKETGKSLAKRIVFTKLIME